MCVARTAGTSVNNTQSLNACLMLHSNQSVAKSPGQFQTIHLHMGPMGHYVIVWVHPTTLRAREVVQC